MPPTPFLDYVRWLHACGYTYKEIDALSDYVYSSSWWRDVIRDGPRNESGTSTVAAPLIDSINGIAKAFNTTPEDVREMIAADWYEVTTGVGVSQRVRNLIPLIDGLSEEDAELVESLLRRLVEYDPGLDEEDADEEEEES